MFRHLGVLLLIFLPITAHAATCDPDQYLDGEFCYTCPANATCDGTNFTCNTGWFTDGAICTQCSVANSSCTGPDDYSCLPGFYDKDGKCNACPDNATCAGGHEYFYCKPGYYKNDKICSSCTGHVCDGEVLISCGDGYYKLANNCNICASSYYCPAGTTNTTISCRSGYYRGGNGNCQVCPTGYFCPLGTTVDNMYDYCAAGYYRTGGSCSECPDGVVCPGGILDEMTCPDGLFKHDDGAQSIDMCQKRCDGGTYVATPKSNTCTNVGAGYWIGENYTNYGATGTPNACDDGMTTSGYGAGADESADCGRILHVGDKIIYLRSARRTTPSLMVKYADKLFYGNMSPNAPGDVKIKIGNTIYSLYDDSMIE